MRAVGSLPRGGIREGVLLPATFQLVEVPAVAVPQGRLVAPPQPFAYLPLRWELAYGLQFIGLEFFFRGFMVHGTKHRFGFYAIFVMMVPYCMIHFRKPMPETCGAIVAGMVMNSTISYAVNGKQYIAILAGSRDNLAIISNSPELKNMSTASMLYVFAL